MTKSQKQTLKITLPKLKSELKKSIDFFETRDEYKIELRRMIKKYGIAGLPAAVQRSIPTDRKVLYELGWKMQPVVWIRILQIAWLNAGNKAFRMALNG